MELEKNMIFGIAITDARNAGSEPPIPHPNIGRIRVLTLSRIRRELNSMFGSQPCTPRNHPSGSACGFLVPLKTEKITSKYNSFTCTGFERDI